CDDLQQRRCSRGLRLFSHASARGCARFFPWDPLQHLARQSAEHAPRELGLPGPPAVIARLDSPPVVIARLTLLLSSPPACLPPPSCPGLPPPVSDPPSFFPPPRPPPASPGDPIPSAAEKWIKRAMTDGAEGGAPETRICARSESFPSTVIAGLACLLSSSPG